MTNDELQRAIDAAHSRWIHSSAVNNDRTFLDALLNIQLERARGEAKSEEPTVRVQDVLRKTSLDDIRTALVRKGFDIEPTTIGFVARKFCEPRR